MRSTKGIVGETPRAEDRKPTNPNNQHDGFDADDEMLMKEILDSMDPPPLQAQLML